MKSKVKIFAIFTTLVLCIATMGYGVWAALATLTTSASGTISFTATNIYADITGTIKDAGKINTNITSKTATMPKYSFDYNLGTNDGKMDTAGSYTLPSWSNNIQFDEAGTDIKIEITIANKANRALYVNITDEAGAISNLSKTVTCDEVNILAQNYQIGAGATKTVLITLHIADTGYDVSASYNYNVRLMDVSQV